MSNSNELEQEFFETTIDVRRYLDVILHWWRLIALLALVGAGIAFLLASLVPASYEAIASVILLRSTTVLNFDPKFRTVSELDPSQFVDQTARRRALITLAESPEVATQVLKEVNDPFLTVDLLLRIVYVTSDSELLEIHARSVNPEYAALIANTWAKKFESLANQVYTEGLFTTEDLKPQLVNAKQEYDTKQAALVAYLAQNPVPALTNEIAETQAIVDGKVKQRLGALADLYAIQNKVARVLVNAKALRERLANSENADLSGLNLAALLLEGSAYSTFAELPVGLQLPIAALNSNNAAALQASLDSLIRALKAEQTQLETQIQVESQNLLNDTKSAQASSAQDPLDQTLLQQEINVLTSKLESETAKKQQLTSARDLAWTTYTTLASKLQEANIAEQSRGSVLRVATLALPPTTSSASRRSLNTLLGGAIGLLVGVVLAFVLDWSAGSLIDVGQVKRFLSLPTLGVLPVSRKKNAQDLSPPYVESLRELRHQLVQDESRRVVMFTSPDDAQGTSELVADLAKVTAQGGKRVLLVDANLRDSTLSKRLNVPAAPGLSDLLQSPTPLNTWQSVTQDVGIANLTYIPAGANVTDPIALFESRDLALVFEQFKDAFDFVLVNASPVLGTVDTAPLGRAVKGVVLIIDRLATRRSKAQTAKELLAENGAFVMGVVLARVANESGVRTRLIQWMGPRVN